MKAKKKPQIQKQRSISFSCHEGTVDFCGNKWTDSLGSRDSFISKSLTTRPRKLSDANMLKTAPEPARKKFFTLFDPKLPTKVKNCAKKWRFSKSIRKETDNKVDGPASTVNYPGQFWLWRGEKVWDWKTAKTSQSYPPSKTIPQTVQRTHLSSLHSQGQ